MLISAGGGVIMRYLVKNDAQKVYRVIDGSRDYLRQWLPWVDGTVSPGVVEKVIAGWEDGLKNKQEIVLGIFSGSEYIGNIGLHDIGSYNSSSMIGYWLAQVWQGRGVMTDCVRALADYGFLILGLNRIYIQCAAGNRQSRAIPERLGFAMEGVLQDGECLYGVFHDLAIYGMVKRNWRQSGTLCLVYPEPGHRQAALACRQEYADYGENYIHGSGGLFQAEDYGAWLEKVTAARSAPQPGWVPCTTYFAFAGGRLVGTIQVRHILNDALINTGGHIGYGVIPSERRKGYATGMLRLALEECRSLGIGRVLVTCNRDNAASAGTIEKCGGVLENEFTEENGNIVKRYWITV